MATRKKVLVLGAAGQLGRRVCDKFLESQWHTLGAETYLAINNIVVKSSLPQGQDHLSLGGWV